MEVSKGNLFKFWCNDLQRCCQTSAGETATTCFCQPSENVQLFWINLQQLEQLQRGRIICDQSTGLSCKQTNIKISIHVLIPIKRWQIQVWHISKRREAWEGLDAKNCWAIRWLTNTGETCCNTASIHLSSDNGCWDYNTEWWCGTTALQVQMKTWRIIMMWF